MIFDADFMFKSICLFKRRLMVPNITKKKYEFEFQNSLAR